MAAVKRLSHSAVDWAKFASLVPQQYTKEFRHLKHANDKFVGKVNALPAELKPIDFAKYKSRGVPAALVDSFANQYKSLEIAYPKDLGNRKEGLDKEESLALKTSQSFVALLEENIKASEEYVAAVSLVPELDQMTHEMYMDYFPEMVHDDENCVEGVGYRRDRNDPSKFHSLIEPMQDEIRNAPAKFWSYIEWVFCFGPYKDHYKRLHSDQYPENKQLESDRLKWLVNDGRDNRNDEKVEHMEFPVWTTDEDMKEYGWDEILAKSDALALEAAAERKLADGEKK